MDTSATTNHGESNNANGGFSRRTFVKGGLAAGVAALGGMALTGCAAAPASSKQAAAADAAAPTDEITARLVERVHDANLPPQLPEKYLAARFHKAMCSKNEVLARGVLTPETASRQNPR